jgi:hypothetical protein
MNWGDIGSNIYNWGSDNPFAALSLGAGAVGTGMGIWDQFQTNQAISQQNKLLQQRQRAAEAMARQGPQPVTFTDAQTQAYMRPWMGDAAARGLDPGGGSWRQAAADASAKLAMEGWQLGNQNYQSQLGALGMGSPQRMIQQPSGTTGAFGQSLQNLMLMQALSGRNQQPQQSGAAQTGWMGGGQGAMGGDAGRDRGLYNFLDSDQSIPDWSNIGAGAGQSFGGFYPQSSMGGGGY